MKIEEVMENDQRVLNVKDPYYVSLDTMKVMSDDQVIERENELMTDGPRNKSRVRFDVVKNFDDLSISIFSLSLMGDKSTARDTGSLSVSWEGKVIMDIEDSGFFTEAFSEYYLNDIFPEKRDEAKQLIEQRKKKLLSVLDAGAR